MSVTKQKGMWLSIKILRYRRISGVTTAGMGTRMCPPPFSSPKIGSRGQPPPLVKNVGAGMSFRPTPCIHGWKTLIYKINQHNDIFFRNIKQNLTFPTKKKRKFSARFARLLLGNKDCFILHLMGMSFVINKAVHTYYDTYL